VLLRARQAPSVGAAQQSDEIHHQGETGTPEAVENSAD